MPVSAPVNPRHVEILQTIYADLRQLDCFVTDDVVLHPADSVGRSQVAGRAAVMAHEHALIEMSGDTLRMDVTSVVANDYFGAVLGVLRTTYPQPLAVPFCGLWRFVDGRVAEHWENAYDPAMLGPLRQSGLT